MPGMKLQQFKGMLPRVAAEHLPDGFAQLAQNVKLYSGDLIPYRSPVSMTGSFPNAQTLYRDGDRWGSYTTDVDMVSVSTGREAPMRDYTTGDGVPKVGELPLGLPVPNSSVSIIRTDGADAPINPIAHIAVYIRSDNVACVSTVAPSGFKVGDRINVLPDYIPDGHGDFAALGAVVLSTGAEGMGSPHNFCYRNVGDDVGRVEAITNEAGEKQYAFIELSGVDSQRDYVYTWLTREGEESIPSKPIARTSPVYIKDGGHVSIQFGATERISPPRADIIGVRLYRTVTSASGTSYLRVKTFFFQTIEGIEDFPVGDQTVLPHIYRDKSLASELAIPLPSADYDAPPEGMIGLREMHNNILVGFAENELCFSFPNTPHAWPERYRLSLTHKIVAVEATQGSLLVLTDEYPYIVSGNDPATMTAVRLNTPYTCLSKRSVVVLDNGVMWATHAGLAMYQSGGGLQLASQAAIDWDIWGETYDLPNMCGWYYEGKYLGCDGTKSFIFYPDQQAGYFVGLDQVFDAAKYYEADGELYYVRDGTLYKWDADPTANLEMTWQSKRYRSPDKVNYGAAKVEAEYSEAGQCQFRLGRTQASSQVSEREVENNKVFRLPSGYKDDTVDITIKGTVRVSSVHVAETPEGLKGI